MDFLVTNLLDMDDHGFPGPPKRQCTEHSTDHTSSLPGSSKCDEASQDDDKEKIERITREKLKKLQDGQVVRGFVDNAINRIVERHLRLPQWSIGSMHECHFPRFLSNNEMEDAAVQMAIRNHGLVQSIQSTDEYKTNFCNAEEQLQMSSQFSPGASESTATSSSSSLKDFTADVTQAEWNAGRVDEPSQQHDFLERAVAEAIKKKGLSTLSVDYG